MPDSTNQGITFPLPGDLVRNPSAAAQLASDMGTLARTADDAIRAGDASVRGEAQAEAQALRYSVNTLSTDTQAALAQQRTDFDAALDSIETAYDVAVADGYTGTITEWLDSLIGPRGPVGPYGGTEVTDPQVAQLVEEETATSAALAGALVARGTILHDVRDYGAVGDNTTDDSAAFNAAVAAAKASGGRAYAWGTFRVEQPIRIDSHADFSNATVNYHGPTDGTAFTVTGWRLDVAMPAVFNGLKSHGGGWDHIAGSIGVLLLNCNGCDIHVKFVQGFEEGLTVLGANGGCAYNTVTLGWLFNNKRNQVLTTDSTTSVGYSNQNTYIGGRLSHHGAEGENVPGMVSLAIGGTGDGGPNSNLWLNTCLEGAQAEYAFDIERGRDNKLVNVRLEYGNAVRFGPGASRNEVTVGYYTAELTQVRDDPRAGNDLIYPTHAFLYDKDDEHWREGDAYPWMRHRWSNRSFALGNGSNAPLEIAAGVNTFTMGGAIRPSEDNAFDLGSGSRAWRNAIIAGRITSGGGIDFRSTTPLFAAAGLARMHVTTNSDGKMELRMRWPNNALSILATEP